MSRIRADRIVNRAATGSPIFPNGAVVTGVITATGAVVTGVITATSYDGIGDAVAGGSSGLMTGADKTKLDGLAPPLSDTVQSTSTTTNSPTTTTVTSAVNDLTMSYTLTMNGATPEGTVTFSQGGNADDATLENFMQNVLGNAVTGESFVINYVDGNGQSRSTSFTIDTVTITDANTMSGVEFTYSGGVIDQAPGNYDNILTQNFQHISLSSYTVSITGSNNPIFDSTQQVTIDNVVYNANTWSVSGTTATQTFSTNPNIVQGDSIAQAYHGFITLAEKQKLDNEIVNETLSTTGSNVITNGNWGTCDGTGWTTGSATYTEQWCDMFSGIKYEPTRTGGTSTNGSYQAFTTTPGATYNLSVDTYYGSGVKIFDGTGTSGTAITSITSADTSGTVDTLTTTFTASSSTTTLSLQLPSVTNYGFDNVVVTEQLSIPVLKLHSVGAGETYAKFTENGSAELYYDNSVKLETSSSGVNVTGILTCTGSITADGATLNGIKVENGKMGGSTSLSGEFDFFLEDGHVQRFNAATSGDYWPDFKVSSTKSLLSAMPNSGDTITATLIVASSSHYMNNPSGLRFKIDNLETNIDTVYVGGSAPSAPNGSGWDIYHFTIIMLQPSSRSYAVIINAMGAGV